jgi:hypothetical protein
VTIEEQRLAEMLHRVTPEPPRGITTEDIAIRLANAGAGSPRRGGPPSRSRSRSGSGPSRGPNDTAVIRGPGRPGRGRRWSPLLAAASVVVVIAGSTGLALALTSHNSPAHPAAAGSGVPTTTQATPSTQSATTAPSSAPATGPAMTPVRIANGPWGAELIDSDNLTPGTLVGSGSSLYAVSDGYLLRIDAKSGAVKEEVPYSAPISGQPPVVDGNTIWVVSSYGGGTVGLRGYDAQTLAPAGSVTVTSSGTLASEPEGIMAAGPDGNLYVAAGNSVAVVSASSGSEIRRISVAGGPADSVAVTPDGSTLYVGTAGAVNFGLVSYNAATGAQLAANHQVADQPGNLVATSGGAYGTVGVGMAEEVSFFPASDLSSVKPVSSAANGGSVAVPTLADGAVWVGGTRQLECLGPENGLVQNSAAISSVSNIPDQFGSVAYADGNTYAIYSNPHTQQAGVVKLAPPNTCTD